MKLTEAQSVIREVSGKSCSWICEWGLSIVRDAIYTIRNRKSATEVDRELADSVQWKIARKW